MKKQKRVWMYVLLAGILLLGNLFGVVLRTEAQGTYPQTNMFKDTYDIKGLQGAKDSNKNDFGGLSHSLSNINLDEAIFSPDSDYAKKGWAVTYEFEGEKFYFTPFPPGMQLVQMCNNSNMSVSAVFLVRWNDGSRDPYNNNTNFLIDEASRVPGHKFYAPNANLSTYGGRAIRAYWHYLMEMLESRGMHIDNFILGNEVNMPNHWHYSGSTDVNVVATKYADAFYYMYEAVRKHTDVSRCSISIDHSWTHNDEGRGIGAKYFLHTFHNRLAQHQSNVDWCVSAHLYPAILTDTRIWLHPYGLTTNSSNTAMVDGTNLSAMTNYIRDTFGSQHRVMLTEQGFTNNMGSEAQAASLAYTYYAAMYDPMVDCFLLNDVNSGYQLDFRINGTLAGTVYTKIGNGNAADQKWIADTCLPIIGAPSWAAIIPNWGEIQSITLNKNETLALNESKQLSVTVFPENLKNQTLLWTSSNPSAVTVDDKGTITAMGSGSATITVTAKFANHVSSSCTVTVKQLVEKVTLDKYNVILTPGRKEKLTATLLPEGTSNKSIVWTTTDPGVATVDAEGNIIAVGVGSALITASAQDGSGQSASCTITVKQPIEKVLMDKYTLTLFVGRKENLTATVSPENASDKSILWISTDEKVATVDANGKVTAVGVGTALITACSQDGSGQSGSCTVTVVQPVEKIEMSQYALTMVPGQKETLTATVLPDNAGNKAIIWTTTDETVANVDANGNVTAVGVGTALITACSQDGSGQSGSCTVTVAKPVESIILNAEKLELHLAETYTMKANVMPEDATNKAFVWISSNEKVATINEKGKIVIHDAGTSTITAVAQDGSGVVGSCILTVSVEEGNPFYDVASNKWYYKFALRAYNEDIMKGSGTHQNTGTVMFKPEEYISREQFVQMLYNREGKPEVEYESLFSDVPEQSSKHWYSNAIMWAAKNNLVSGYSNGKFGVGDKITREQVAVILKKYAAFKGYNVEFTKSADDLKQDFQDVTQISSWAVESMCWAVEYGVMSGKTGGWLSPLGNAQRVEAITMLINLLDAYKS